MFNTKFQIPSELMSHSAPQTHPLQFDSDQSINSKIKSDESLAREVQRTISLTSENPSETFFSADEDMHSSSLRTSINDRVNQRKRFASDLRFESLGFFLVQIPFPTMFSCIFCSIALVWQKIWMDDYRHIAVIMKFIHRPTTENTK